MNSLLLVFFVHHRHDTSHLNLVILRSRQWIPSYQSNLLQHALNWVQNEIDRCLLKEDD